MDTSVLDGYKKLIVTFCTLLGAIISVFVTDPAKAQTIGGFITSTLPTILITLVGIVYTIVQGNIDKEKAKTAATEAKAQAIMAQEASPKADSASAVQPAVAQPVQAAPVETYKPIDLDAYVGSAEKSVKADGLVVDPMNRATYFWPCMANFDLREVPRQFRISESKRLVQKALDLFTEAFKWYTKLDALPTPAQAANRNSFMLQLKKDFEKANNMICSNKTFEELRYMVGDFNDLYTALDGLNQLEGKTIDWSIYGEAGNAGYGPLQVGWDYAKLL